MPLYSDLYFPMCLVPFPFLALRTAKHLIDIIIARIPQKSKQKKTGNLPPPVHKGAKIEKS